MLCLMLLLTLSTRSNAQKISSTDIKLLDCKRAYVKLSNERDTLKAMFADSLVKHRFERVSWILSTKEQVKTSKKWDANRGLGGACLGCWALRHWRPFIF